VFDDAQIRHRAMRRDLDGVPQVANPLRLSATPVDYRSPPPALGAHTAAVLARELGLAAAELSALAGRGVIGIG
jgi:crotonobetainyl-CoA:carnitine CoA-transferase CaiB-like acyl-CoA transferase